MFHQKDIFVVPSYDLLLLGIQTAQAYKYVFDMKGGRSTTIATYEVDAKSGFSTSEESHGWWSQVTLKYWGQGRHGWQGPQGLGLA